MKIKIFPVVFLLLLSTFGFSQDLSLSIVPAQGGFDKTDDITLEWTLGESFVETINHTNKIYTQGFHQSFIQLKLNVNEPFIDYNIYAYPNPVASQLNVHFDVSNNSKLILYIFDIHGRKLKEVSTSTNNNSTSIDMSDLSSGIYMLHISDTDGSVFETHKILKK